MRIALFAVLAVAMLSCRQKPTALAKTTIIDGKISNPQVYPEYRKMKLEVKGFGGTTSVYIADIQKDGSFKIKFDQYIAQDMKLSPFVGVFIAHPGDSIHLDIDFKDIGDVKFAGDAQEINTDLYAYINSNYVVVDDDTLRRVSVGDLKGFMKFNNFSRDELVRKRDSFIVKYQPDDELKAWTKHFVMLKYYNDRAMFLTRYAGYKRYFKLPEFNADSLKAYAIPNADQKEIYHAAIFNTDAYNLLYFLMPLKTPGTTTDRMQSIAGLNQTNIQRRKFADEMATSIKTIADNVGDERIRQLQIANLYNYMLENSDIKDFEYNRKQFDELLTEPFIKQPLIKNYGAVKQRLTHPEIASGKILKNLDANTKALMDTILTKNKGKVIYIDLWATWCAPCKAEMPGTQKMLKAFAGRDVAFVFVCMGENRQEWKQMLAQYQMQGEQHYAGADMTNSLWKGLVTAGIPHHILINKNGDIIENGLELFPERKIIELLN